jgi:hypothetical protein
LLNVDRADLGRDRRVLFRCLHGRLLASRASPVMEPAPAFPLWPNNPAALWSEMVDSCAAFKSWTT